MTTIQRDYLPERKEPAFPRDLAALIAALIAAKAQALATQFEERAISQMVFDARRRLRDGMDAAEIARQLGL